MSTPPACLNSPPSPFPFIELKEDQQIHQFFSASPPPHEDQASSSSLSSPIFFNIAQDQTSSDSPREPPKKEDKFILHGGLSRDHQVLPSSSTHSTIESTKHDNGLSFCKFEGGVNVEDHERDYESSKWMSSKMMNTKGSDNEKQERIIKIKFHGTQDQAQYSNNNINVRVCSDCKTTKTPLWRSGPQGPKSLCNACGIRQRKARRALLAAAAAANGTVLTTDNSTRTSNCKVQKKERKSRTGYISQRKKPFSPANGGDERISVEDFARSLSKSLAFQRAFPKDEEEAAILLMALSCGLLHS